MITHDTVTTTALLTLALVAFAGCGGTPQTTTSTPATGTPTTSTSTTSTSISSTTGPAATSTAPVTTARPTGHLDEFVDVNGTRFHARCDGTGEATVLLIPGFEASSDGWNSVLPALAAEARVCTYDRPGTGTSDPPASTQTFETQAADLRSMLETMGEPGPYVVVGHSFGGAEAIEFTARFTGEVDALVLVDASPVGWPDALCAVDDGTDAAAFLGTMCDRWADPANNLEHLDVFGAFGLAAEPPSLGTLPLTVITAVDRELPPDISDGERDRLNAAWQAGQERWAQMSSASQLVPVPDSGHYVQIDHPDLVIGEITRLLP